MHLSNPSLLVMACSATKRPSRALMPAIERYDGVMWRTLRAALAELSEAARQSVNVWFLSARYGFQRAEMPIAFYEDRLTPKRANELLHLPTSNHVAFATEALAASRILLAGGAVYRETMRRAIGRQFGISETDGGGIGYHRQQLREWLATGTARPAPCLAI